MIKIVSLFLAFLLSTEPCLAAVPVEPPKVTKDEALKRDGFFDCQYYMHQLEQPAPDDPITASIEKFAGQKPALEDVLGWIGALLGDSQGKLVYLTQEQMEKTPVIRDSAKPQKGSVNYVEQSVSQRSIEDLSFFFDAIRATFSKDLGGAEQWNNSTPNEKRRLNVTFRWRAVRTLFLEYRLYQRIKELGKVESMPELVRDFRLAIPAHKPFRLLSPEDKTTLFDEVYLSFTLFDRLVQLPDQTHAAIEKEIQSYVDLEFSAQAMEVYYKSRPGLLKNFSYVTIVAVGIAFAFYFANIHPRITPPAATKHSFEVLKSDVPATNQGHIALPKDLGEIKPNIDPASPDLSAVQKLIQKELNDGE